MLFFMIMKNIIYDMAILVIKINVWILLINLGFLADLGFLLFPVHAEIISEY